MSSRQLRDLHPDLQIVTSKFLKALHDAGLDILVTCTYRSDAEQDELYAQGRTSPGKKVTNARGGQSDHNFTINGETASKAFDIVPLREGAPVWIRSAPEWEAVGRVWREFGDKRLLWGKSFGDMPHFYFKG